MGRNFSIERKMAAVVMLAAGKGQGTSLKVAKLSACAGNQQTVRQPHPMARTQINISPWLFLNRAAEPADQIMVAVPRDPLVQAREWDGRTILFIAGHACLRWDLERGFRVRVFSVSSERRR